MAEPLRSQKLNMTEGPILGKMIRFTIPVMASGILQLLFNAADVAVVGKFAGEAAMAAVGSILRHMASTVNTLTNFFFIGWPPFEKSIFSALGCRFFLALLYWLLF